MNKRKNLCILFSLILAFFFVGCSDFYQDMAGSSIEMSFKVPEKIDERGVVSRSTSITNIVTYKLVVKLESKNEVLDKIEKNVCSGELVNLAFTNVKKGKTVKVSAQLFQEEECVYIGESDWINTSKGKNYVKVMLEEGELDSISAEYIGGYELYGVEVQKENFKVFANYKVGESIKSLLVDDFNVKNENSRCIGNVPHSITYPTNVPTGFSTTIPVPVKYQLNAEKLAITAFVDDIENTQATDFGRRLKIAQYTQNVQLFAKYDDTVYLYNGETDNPNPINILVNWASYSGGPSIGNSNTLTIQDESEELSQGLATYECTITPNANSDFIVGESVTKQYFVNVCPWQIELKYYGVATPDGFDNKTLEGGVTYLPNLTNEAIVDGLTSSDVTYSVTGEGYSINSLNVIQAPTALTNEQKATIKASLNGKEIASLDVVVPAKEDSGTSGGTTGGGTSTYQIGDVYSENGTAMGVVFEVAEDNSYIKIVALKDLNTNYTWAGSGVFTKNDQPNAYDKNNGDLNLAAIKSYVEANSNYGITLVNDFKIFNYTSQFYQISESEKGEWYVPALNELKNVIQYQNDGKFNNENYTYISQVYSYWSSTLISGTTTAYYATTNNQEQSQSVQTSCYVRPVRKITLEV